MVQKIDITDSFYPRLLKNIFDPPKVLYVLGHAELVSASKMIAVVGTRKMTSCGELVTRKLVTGLVEQGFVIVSGMALGIDTVAHQTAIDCGGKTVAVLGAGVNIVYPRENMALYNSIIEHGAVISEVEPDKMVEQKLFPARNRIISGMCEAVIVVEGEIKSGSLITARLALEQGREVFAVPGSPGTDYLIDQGANDILTR